MKRFSFSDTVRFSDVTSVPWCFFVGFFCFCFLILLMEKCNLLKLIATVTICRKY